MNERNDLPNAPRENKSSIRTRLTGPTRLSREENDVLVLNTTIGSYM